MAEIATDLVPAFQAHREDAQYISETDGVDSDWLLGLSLKASASEFHSWIHFNACFPWLHNFHGWP